MELQFRDHPMTPVKKECDCCGLRYKGLTSGYRCSMCIEFFFDHNRGKLVHPSQTCDSTLVYRSTVDTTMRCVLCRGKIRKQAIHFRCNDCVLASQKRRKKKRFSAFHVSCALYPPPEVIDVPQHHHHKLKLEKVESRFSCATCGKDGDGYPYKCHECDLTFHVDCEKHGAEVNHPSHPLHPLKLFKGEPPAYIDGTCRLCGEEIYSDMFYHCSTCNFTLDLRCTLKPPPLYLNDLNTHDHKLTLVPNLISFTCTTCGMNGDRSPYVCLQCNFFAHNDCTGFPWVININRHDHRVSRTSLLGVVNAVCGVCQKKMDWSCGGYSCKKCPDSTFHTRCATREDVSDCIELKDQPEEDEDTKPFKVIDENTILHFLHEEHSLRLDKSGIFVEERICKACTYPIYHHSLYSCISCDFMLHEGCANMPKRKRHMLGNIQFVLSQVEGGCCRCLACDVCYTGFKYSTPDRSLDVRCASVSEPFFHQSHPHHPLFYTSPRGVCSACNKEEYFLLRCVEDNCGYALDFKCALLPYEVKHRVDQHFLSLCYGDEDASGKYWCDICEKETDPKSWFYTSTDYELTLHIDCVLGGIFRALEPGRKVNSYLYRNFSALEPEIRHAARCRANVTIRNNSMSRPLCSACKSRCILPVILKCEYDDGRSAEYFCSDRCCVLNYSDS